MYFEYFIDILKMLPSAVKNILFNVVGFFSVRNTNPGDGGGGR